MQRKFICLIVLLFLTAVALGAQEDKAHKVAIKNLKYDPAKLTIKRGETVVWVNADDNDHTVTSDEKDGFASENLRNGEKFRHTFDKAGKYPYHCKYHPRMKGVVTVTD